MIRGIAQVALLVREYDETIEFYSGILGFSVLEDTPRPTKRWVRLAPAGGFGSQLLLSRAESEEQRAQVGRQAGGRVFLFLHTDGLDAEYARLRARGVTFTESPRTEAYGKVAVFTDLYGNRLDLIEPA